MNVRRGQVADAQAVYQISEASFSVSWSLAAITEDLAHKDALYFVAEEQGEVVGFVGMRKVLDEGEITNVAVSTQKRDKGIGGKLVAALLEACIAEGVVNVLLEVRQSNAPAQKAYEKNGFVVISKRKGYYQQPKEDALIMQWLYQS